MPVIREVITELQEGDILLRILSDWTRIVGARSRGILFPYKIDRRKKTLRVAVPNAMVRSQYEPLASLIIEKMAKVCPGAGVEHLAFAVEPRFFKRQKSAARPRPGAEPDPEAVAEKTAYLTAQGLSPERAGVLARIAARLERRRHASG